MFSGAAGCLPETASPETHAERRDLMIESQLKARGIKDARVLQAMRQVPRHRFVPERFASQAYADSPLPIGHDQTISQPYIVAAMTELAEIEPKDKVLEIGTGSGYQAAVLGELAAEVYTIEIVEPLGTQAARVLQNLGYENVHVRIGDGYKGWPEHAPFDAIIVTAAPDHVPQPLVDQLGVGGRMVIPVGPVGGIQELKLITKTDEGIEKSTVFPVGFVPLTRNEEK